MDALKKIQQELKAPKSQRNSFGNYNYRSCEDILEAVKPLLAKEDATLLLTDELVQIGDRYYVKATAKFTCGALSSDTIEVSAYAREAETKKGMDDSQITGTASSYARKYALNGLFLIDDTKDADTDEHAKQVKATPTAHAKKVDFNGVRRHLEEITTIAELNEYWVTLALTDGQAAILKGDFAKRKEALGGK